MALKTGRRQVIEIEVKNRNLDNGGTWKETPGKEKVKGTGDSPTHLRLKGDKGKLIGPPARYC
jgi:hypothetical protein